MAISQFHYTSSEYGLAASAGFQFVAAPDSYHVDELYLIEQRIGYELPRPPQLDELWTDGADTPLALSYSLLPDGRPLLTLTRYAGNDFTGRAGNFFTHALRLDAGRADLADLLPIETWRAPHWVAEPQGRSILPALGALDAGQPRDPAKVARILADPGRGKLIEAFLADIHYLMSRRGKVRVIVVDEDSDRVAWWMWLACKSLPHELAVTLSFSTYQRRPDSAAFDIVGTSPRSDWALSIPPVGVELRVHGGLGGAVTPAPAASMAWAEVATQIWHANRPDVFGLAPAVASPADGAPAAGALVVAAVAAGCPISGPAALAAVGDLLRTRDDLPESYVEAALDYLDAAVGRAEAPMLPGLVGGPLAGRLASLPVRDRGGLALARTVAWAVPEVVASPSPVAGVDVYLGALDVVARHHGLHGEAVRALARLAWGDGAMSAADASRVLRTTPTQAAVDGGLLAVATAIVRRAAQVDDDVVGLAHVVTGAQYGPHLTGIDVAAMWAIRSAAELAAHPDDVSNAGALQFALRQAGGSLSPAASGWVRGRLLDWVIDGLRPGWLGAGRQHGARARIALVAGSDDQELVAGYVSRARAEAGRRVPASPERVAEAFVLWSAGSATGSASPAWRSAAAALLNSLAGPAAVRLRADGRAAAANLLRELADEPSADAFTSWVAGLDRASGQAVAGSSEPAPTPSAVRRGHRDGLGSREMPLAPALALLSPLLLVAGFLSTGGVLAARVVRAALRELCVAGGSADVAEPVSNGSGAAYLGYYEQQADLDRMAVRAAARKELDGVAGGRWADGVVGWLEGAGPVSRPAEQAAREAWDGGWARRSSSGAGTAPHPGGRRIAVAAWGCGSRAGIATVVSVGRWIDLLHGVMIWLVRQLSVAAAAVLRVPESAGRSGPARVVLRHRATCLYPACAKRDLLTFQYKCANGHPHRELVPGRLGLLFRVCACGERLPTLHLARKGALDAFCADCGGPLPRGLSRAGVVHVPLVGAANAGKTTLMMAAISSLIEGGRREFSSAAFAFRQDQTRYEHARALLARRDKLDKTTDLVPRAVTLWVRRPLGRRRLVYLYDPAGEVYGDSKTLSTLSYLRRADGLIFCWDMLASPLINNRLDAKDRERLAKATPAVEDPAKTLDLLFYVLRGPDMLGARSSKISIPLAVVIPKMDALASLSRGATPAGRAGPAGQHAVHHWLSRFGLTDQISRYFHDVGYCALSATRATAATPSMGDLDMAVEPLLWIMGRAGGRRFRALARGRFDT